MENLKALVYKGDLTPYQRALAQREFEGMIERLEIYEKAVKNNAVLPHVSDTVCEHEWDLYENKQGELIQYCHKCNSVEQTDC